MSVCGATRIDARAAATSGNSRLERLRASSSSSSTGAPNLFFGSSSASIGPAMNVVTSAMITSAANSASVMTPFSSARFSTISSVRPRVFISVPMTSDARQSKPVSRAAIIAPNSLPTIATTISTPVISHRTGRSSRPMFVRRPV